MWDTPFEESMLGKRVIIHCPEGSDAGELMRILERNGVEWQGTREKPTACTEWTIYRKQTCYWVASGILSFGSLRNATEYAGGTYLPYIKCTFHAGCELPDFEIRGDAAGQLLI